MGLATEWNMYNELMTGWNHSGLCEEVRQVDGGFHVTVRDKGNNKTVMVFRTDTDKNFRQLIYPAPIVS